MSGVPARPRVVAIFGAVAISFSAIFVRLADASPGTSAFFRAAYALPALAALAFVWRARDTRPLRDRVLAVAAGGLLAIDLAMWHRAIPLVGAGLSTVIANLQVLFVGVAAWFLHRERPSRAALLAVPAALLGVVLAAGAGRADAYGASPVAGATLALGAAFAYTAFLLLFRRSGRAGRFSPGPLLDATAGTAAVGLVLAFATDPAFSLRPEWPAHGWILALALLSHTGGWLAISYSLPRLPAVVTSILLLLQPTLTVVWGVLLFGEAPSFVQWAGVALVLASVGAFSWAKPREPK